MLIYYKISQPHIIEYQFPEIISHIEPYYLFVPNASATTAIDMLKPLSSEEQFWQGHGVDDGVPIKRLWICIAEKNICKYINAYTKNNCVLIG